MNVTVCFFKFALINYEDLPMSRLLKFSIEYSFIKKIIHSFAFRIFVLALLKIEYPALLDVGCFSRTLNLVGEHFKLATL